MLATMLCILATMWVASDGSNDAVYKPTPDLDYVPAITFTISDSWILLQH